MIEEVLNGIIHRASIKAMEDNSTIDASRLEAARNTKPGFSTLKTALLFETENTSNASPR